MEEMVPWVTAVVMVDGSRSASCDGKGSWVGSDGEDEGAAVTVRLTVVVSTVPSPPVPVTVTVDVPVAAFALAMKLMVVLPEGPKGLAP